MIYKTYWLMINHLHISPRAGHPTSVPDWMYLTQQNLSKAGGQLEGSFQLRSVVQGILAQVRKGGKARWH